MSTFNGFVTGIYQHEDYAWLRINAAPEHPRQAIKFLVYSDYVEDYAPHQRVVHGTWMAMARAALTSGTRVEVEYESPGVLMFSFYMLS